MNSYSYAYFSTFSCAVQERMPNWCLWASGRKTIPVGGTILKAVPGSHQATNMSKLGPVHQMRRQTGGTLLGFLTSHKANINNLANEQRDMQRPAAK